MNKDLKYIKKHYSEKLSHICRELFPTLLETPSLLPQILDRKFDKTSSLGEALSSEDAQQDFKEFVYSFVDVEKPQPEIIGPKNAFDLMAKAGYKLYPECLTEADIQSFRHLYHRNGPTPVYTGGKPEMRAGEEICTFNGNRLNKCRVWFAVKEGAENLKRTDFTSPTRQDEYGTSVISIQFTKNGTPTLSIKNRYNHSVNNPDATFSNNLENIIPGLTQAWAETFSMILTQSEEIKLSLEDFRLANDGKYYKINCQDNAGISYCENNVIIDHGHPVKLGTDCMLVDNHIFDFKSNRVISYQTYRAEHPELGLHQQPAQEDPFGLVTEETEDTSFIESLGKVTKLEIQKGTGKERIISVKTEAGEDVIVTIGKHNEIVAVHDPNSTELQYNYLGLSSHIRDFSAPKVVTIGNAVLTRDSALQTLHLPNVEVIGNNFTSYTTMLQGLDLPKVREIGSSCFSNTLIQKLNIPCLEKIGNSTFSCFNSVNVLGNQFFRMIKEDQQEDLFLNNPLGFLRITLDDAGQQDRDTVRSLCPFSLQIVNAPRLREIGNNCFSENEVKVFIAPQLEVVGTNCFNQTSISSFSCGIPITQQEHEPLSESDQNLLNICIKTIIAAQKEMIGGKESSQRLETPPETTIVNTTTVEYTQAQQVENNAILQAETEVVTDVAIQEETNTTFNDWERYHRENHAVENNLQQATDDAVQE